VLGLPSAAAEERPLLCLVEDAHWLDAASGLILGFVERRLQADSVAIVVSIREPETRHDFDRLPELRLRGLAEEDARTLRRHLVERQQSRQGSVPSAVTSLGRSVSEV
jgi:predicted ATPase